jgi:transcriptional regulator with XRE-family HTH domain
MIIGDRLRRLREVKNFSQAVIEQRTGLLRCYISRLENGHTVPGIETLEKMARALEVPMYQLFYDDDEPPQVPKTTTAKESDWAGQEQGARYFAKLRRSLGRMSDQDRGLLLHLVHKMATATRAGATKSGKSRDSARD